MNAPRARVARRPVHGVLLLDKPLGWSSNDALQKVKWLLRAEKAGHTGTLDPLATGVLPLCFGAATKFSQLQLDADKTYEAVARLGCKTSTGDAEGDVLEEREVNVSEADIHRVLPQFTGPIRQIPPMHSALKKDGKALYEYARAGLVVERAARDVTIHALKVTLMPMDKEQLAIKIVVKCSKGTYIRTLGEDIGEALGCGAHLSALRRLETGGFSVTQSVTLEALEAMTEAERLACLMPVDALLRAHTVVTLDSENAGRFLRGVRRRGAWPDDEQVAVYGAQPHALLGSAHTKGGELIPGRLLSPIEIEQILGAVAASPSTTEFEKISEKATMSIKQIRNIAIIAHVDHGKTTMVDQLLRQSGTFADHEKVVDTVMDNNAIEKERGITILAKNCAVSWEGTHINIVDTPGHADFGGEVERALSMVDGVVLLIDAQEGPMPQTRFVTKKALALGLKPIVVVNKVDKPGANPDKVVNAAFDLFDKLGATDEQLDFPVVYASGINGWSSLVEGAPGEQWGPDMSALFNTVLNHVPAQKGDPAAPLQLQISALDFSTFVGRIGVGRISQGTIKPMMDVVVMEGPDGKAIKGRINQLLTFQGLERVQATEAGPGEIVLINGIGDIGIGVTITDPVTPMPLPMLKVDEPTLTMNFCVNTSPLAGREGKYVTSRQIWDRLQKELQHNVALRVSETDEEGIFEVMGRGELHLTILLENMRREGYEMAVSKPRVMFKDINGEKHEPIELVTADIEEQHQGGVMQALGERKGELVNMEPDGRGRVRLEYRIPARGLIGFTNEFLNLTRGSCLIANIFDCYEPHKGEIGGRKNGVLISMDAGEIFTYALGKLDDRGRMFVKANDPVYEGMIVGIHNRDNDLVVNATRTKQLTNFRVSGKEDAIKITPPIDCTLEYGVEFIEDDELVEITPKSIRLRKRYLTESERKRAGR